MATKAKTKRPATSPAKPGQQVPLATLTSLIGKTVDDPAVVAVFDKSGKMKIDSDFAVAKEAGFDFALDRVNGKKKKVLHTLFLFPEGGDGHRGFDDLPKGFPFVSRRELLATNPAPVKTWKIGPGSVPVDTPDNEVAHDIWLVDGFEILASYTKAGRVGHYCVSLPEDTTSGGPLDADTVYWEVLPYDAPPDASLVGMAVLVAWATERFGLSVKHANTELGKQLAGRAITPRTFLIRACKRTLSTLDVAPKVREFLSIYTRHEHHSDEGARKPVGSRIKDLLKLSRDDERRFTDDFIGTFADVLESAYYVPDSWDAVDRMAPVLDARFADYEATRFRTVPDLALYETAAVRRDKQAVTPDRATMAAAVADDKLAEELVALIDKPLTDKQVKTTLAKTGLPVGKRIDAQANPALGVSYMGSKFEIDGRNQLGIADVAFYADRYEHPIRGIGKTVRFRGYPGLLPYGLRLGDSRETVRGKVGKAMKSGDEQDWFETRTRRTSFTYQDNKLVMLRIATKRDD